MKNTEKSTADGNPWAFSPDRYGHRLFSRQVFLSRESSGEDDWAKLVRNLSTSVGVYNGMYVSVLCILQARFTATKVFDRWGMVSFKLVNLT